MAMPVGHQDHGGVPVATPVSLGRIHQSLDSSRVRCSRVRSSAFGRRSGVTVRFSMVGDTSLRLEFAMRIDPSRERPSAEWSFFGQSSMGFRVKPCRARAQASQDPPRRRQRYGTGNLGRSAAACSPWACLRRRACWSRRSIRAICRAGWRARARSPRRCWPSRRRGADAACRRSAPPRPGSPTTAAGDPVRGCAPCVARANATRLPQPAAALNLKDWIILIGLVDRPRRCRQSAGKIS
jgi:hypothetical protein